MTTIDTFTSLIAVTHAWFEATMSDVTTEQAHWKPPGVSNPIGAVYAHALVGSDGTLNTILNRRSPVFEQHGSGTAGLSQLPIRGDWHAWAGEVLLDLEVLRPYARAVYDCWAEYLRTLSDTDLERVVDLSAVKMGTRTLADVLGMQVQHFSGHCGEIACLKGLQGSVGYRPGTKDGIG